FGAVAAAAAVLTLAAACTPSPAQEHETADPTADTSTAEEVSPYPLTVDNCGFPVTLEGPPERIVTIKSTSTELVLALGLGEKLVGTAFPDGELPEDLALPDPPPPELSDKAPGSEAVLAVE